MTLEEYVCSINADVGIYRIGLTCPEGLHVAGVMEPELSFAKRFIKFNKMALISENNTVCTISKMGQYSSYSILGGERILNFLMINIVWMK